MLPTLLPPSITHYRKTIQNIWDIYSKRRPRRLCRCGRLSLYIQFWCYQKAKICTICRLTLVTTKSYLFSSRNRKTEVAILSATKFARLTTSSTGWRLRIDRAQHDCFILQYAIPKITANNLLHDQHRPCDALIYPGYGAGTRKTGARAVEAFGNQISQLSLCCNKLPGSWSAVTCKTRKLRTKSLGTTIFQFSVSDKSLSLPQPRRKHTFSNSSKNLKSHTLFLFRKSTG